MPVPHLLVEHDTLLHLCVCCGKVTLTKSQLPKEASGCRNPLFEAHLSRECEAFLEQGADPRLVALGIKERLCQLRESVGDAPLVSELSVYCHALLIQGTGPGVLTPAAGYERQ